MIILLAADHAGFALKEKIKMYLIKRGYNIRDLTPIFRAGDDYPPIAKHVARLISKHLNQQAILICGSGYGMDIAANRFKGVRAIVARTTQDAVMSRQDDHGNILVLGGRVTKPELAKKIVDTWLKTKPLNAARHLRRVKQLDA
ncbi:MAG: RpiB/LacA/LacB family sugar-phosphate isomerase [Candidatus Uhrbacteria bacterium]|nr:RpiB/LacA/LacB family sugar-phosphate isomerase [Candidatus Uhrbacteria bacterium]